MGFNESWAKTHAIEGGYSNNPDDPGGETNHGITKRVAQAYGYTGAMKDLSPERAKDIAKKAYWDVLILDRICVLSDKVADELFDTGYNCGQGIAAEFLQKSLNALNRQQKDYMDIPVDRRIGITTVGVLVTYFKHRGDEGETILLRALNSLQGARYIELANKNEALETFVYGWFKARVA